MRIVLDGTVSAGKTTLITGISQRNPNAKRLEGLVDFGFPIFTDWIVDIIADIREMGYEDPRENWELFFEMALEKSIINFENALPNTINFYDRGINFLEIMAKRYKVHLPQKYYDFCSRYRYDDPVFILEPVLSIELVTPHSTDNQQKIYTRQERIQQHYDTVDLYKKWGYKVIVLPLVGDTPEENQKFRIKRIKEVLGI